MTEGMRRLTEEIVSYAGRIARLDLAPNTQGNLSARDPESGLVAITPHDYPYEEMTPEDVVILDLAGRSLADIASHLTRPPSISPSTASGPTCRRSFTPSRFTSMYSASSAGRFRQWSSASCWRSAAMPR